MYKLSGLVGKNVIGLYEAKSAGTLSGALLDKNMGAVRCFEVLSEGEDDLCRRFFSPECLWAMDGDAVVLHNCGKLKGRLSLPASYVRGPINAAAYSPDGRLLGRVTDLTLDGFSVVGIDVGELSFPPESVLSRSDEIIIINDKGEKIKLVPPVSRRVPSPDKASALAAVVAHSAEENAAAGSDNSAAADNSADNPEETAGEESTERERAPEHERADAVRGEDSPAAVGAGESGAVDLPLKVSGENVSVTPGGAGGRAAGYAFLLGKTATREVYGDDGMPLVRGGERIDDDALSRVANAGKLVWLALHSR